MFHIKLATLGAHTRVLLSRKEELAGVVGEIDCWIASGGRGAERAWRV
jgi:hypothetical protein